MGDPKTAVSISPGVKVESLCHCPACNYGPMDGATGMMIGDDDKVAKESKLGPMRPKDGQFTICGKCGAYLVYVKEMPLGLLGLRLATEEDLAPYRQYPKVWELIETIAAKARRGELLPNKWS